MQSITVTMIDWQKFNPRSDRANYSWFRFENKFYIKTFSWGPERQRLFTYLCCCASQENKATFELDLQLASTFLRRKTEHILKDLKALEGFDVITTAPSRHEAGYQTSLLPATNVTNVTNVTNERNDGGKPPVFDFEILYLEYPRKEGKSEGIKKCKSQIKTILEYENLRDAIARYRDHVQKAGTETRFVKQFSTFMGCWRDWLDPRTGTAEVRKTSRQKVPEGLPPGVEKPHPKGPLSPEVKKLLEETRKKMGRVENTQ
jgi:hypothetical protein